MSEQNNKGKKIAIIVVAVVAILAIIAAAIVLVTKNGDKGPADADGNPYYPKASNVTSVEYLHRGGLDSKKGLSLEDKELTNPEGIDAFLEELKTVELVEATDKDRAAVDYTADVEMFTLKLKEGNDDTILLMGDTISINNEFGNYFFVAKGLDLKTLTKDFEATDVESKLSSTDASTED